MDTDSDGNKASESGEDTATTPSSIKINKSLANERVKPMQMSEFSYGRKKMSKKVVKPPMICDSSTISNHLEFHIHLSNKKALYYNMKMYYESLEENPFDYIPLTYHIKDGVDSQEFK